MSEEPKTPIPMEQIHIGKEDIVENTFENLRISMDISVGDMGNYAQQR